MGISLLVIIYIAFISLGLPDALLGSAWPAINLDLSAPEDFAGYIGMTVTAGTIISSLSSSRLIRKHSTSKIVTVSVFLIAVSLLGISFVRHYPALILFAVPLGLGAGAIDSVLNEFVAEHYQASHMNWLHSFWGIGAMSGPLILSALFASGFSWRGGYRIISGIQFIVFALLLFSLGAWQRVPLRKTHTADTAEKRANQASWQPRSIRELLSVEGVRSVLVTVLLYCGIEQSLILWGATFLINTRSVTDAVAAGWSALYLVGIMSGRILSGFISTRVSNKTMIHGGILTVILGLIVILIPSTPLILLLGFLLAGLGSGPIFPATLHETPGRFGKEIAQDIMGLQMASAYTGSMIIPPLIGIITTRTSMGLLPLILSGFAVLMYLANRQTENRFYPSQNRSAVVTKKT